jgi:hypothetical protein
MIAKSYSRFFTNWNHYLTFLWLIAIAFAVFIIIGYAKLSRVTDENPASGLAFVGVVTYLAILLLFIGFIVINYFVRKKIAANVKVSNRFLVTSWTIMAILTTGVMGAITMNQVEQLHYEKNVAPKLNQCYQEYLDGDRPTPYDKCVESDR